MKLCYPYYFVKLRTGFVTKIFDERKPKYIMLSTECANESGNNKNFRKNN
jgi:hypothetical protein